LGRLGAIEEAVKRRSLLLGLAACACHGSKAPPLSFARAALKLARDAGQASAEQESSSISELCRIAKLAETELQKAPGVASGRVLSRLLFDQLGFAREVTNSELRFVLLPNVLQGRRGNCVGLGTLFLALSQALGWTANGVLMPGHFYVRLQEHGQPRNIELLHRGEAMPTQWYSGRFPVPGGGAREYGRPLTETESLGVIAYDVGSERRRQLRFEDARRAFVHATQLFPEFAEAHASLGATLQVLGKLDEAAASYQIARNMNPHLPGVDRNVAILEDEQGTSE
jgi:regulator of sirC expression with transglutaminase-like and TPR domain